MPNATAFVVLRQLLRRCGQASLLIALAVSASLLAIAAATPPNIPAIALSGTPLYASTESDKPTITLALSVEFPTVGAQYPSGSNPDNSYSNAKEYLGYYDAESCYTYNDTPKETPSSPLTAADYKRFDRSGPAKDRMCDDAFSGNYLNWASSSAIDMLRLSLTGGDRYIDTPTLTILQRAVLPEGDPMWMWKSNYFPAKQLLRSGGASGRAYFGAVPQVLAKAAVDKKGKPTDLYAANTLNKVCFGTSTDDRDLFLGRVLSSDDCLYTRVQVCHGAAGVLQDTRDYPLCTKYPFGNYKPTGAIQKYGNELRIAAFGYLMDQSNSGNGGRYGGVLRAPMKYVGDKTYDSAGVENTPANGNPAREWDPDTGVFYANPDNDATFKRSGVINYLNLFGRVGPVKGRYKVHDPVGELHYEALRYLQGLPPIPEAVSNITTEMYDGFPVYTTWRDPYGDGRSSTADYSCQKCNIVVIGDQNTWDGNRLPRPDAANNIPNIDYWRSVVQSFEQNAGGSYRDGQGQDRKTENPHGRNGSVPTNKTRNQIMGSAYWAHTHDIRGKDWTATADRAAQSGNPADNLQRPGLRAKTFIFDVNEDGAENNTDRRRHANQFFMAAKYGGFEADPSNYDPANNKTKPFNTWGNPFRREDETLDDAVWAETSGERAGEAQTYYLQSQARGVLKAFDEIFSRAVTQAHSIAGGAMSSKSITSAGSTLFQSSFNTSNWSGDVLATTISANGTNITASATPKWSASARLSAMSSASRKIFVGNGGAATIPVAAPFQWATPAGRDGISDNLRAELDKSPDTSSPDGHAEDRLNYLRGDQSKEGSLFRVRKEQNQSRLLGDIINSAVVYSGAPTSSIGGSSYAEFYKANADRVAAVFVGANDGMLHAFNAETGDELFAYIPSWLGPKLAALTGKSYAAKHQSYVDSTPAVAEVQTGSSGTAADWKTVLVSGTGGGGHGVFALDVTAPDRFDAANVLWEFTHADDPDLGNVIGTPQLLKFKTSAAGVTPATYKWFAVVASGVNSHVQDAAGFGSGNPALFLLDIGKPAGVAWTAGVNYYKLIVPLDASLAARKSPGLVNFSAALGPERAVAQIYLGDLHGNLWKLDFSGKTAANWTFGELSAFNAGSAAQSHPIPLYIAKDASGNVQPITMAPAIAYGPIPTASYVLFGTGKYLERTDNNDTAPQSVYMIYDDGTTANDSDTPSSAISGRGRLQAGSAIAATAQASGSISTPALTLGRPTSDSDTSQRAGWYFDLPTAKERAIYDVTISANQALFNTLVPDSAGNGSGCSAASGGGGGGFSYSVDLASGDGSSSISTVGILGAVLFAELPEETTTSESDNTGRRIKTITSRVIQQGSKGMAAGQSVETKIVTGRLSWRQIFNYLQLKNAP